MCRFDALLDMLKPADEFLRCAPQCSLRIDAHVPCKIHESKEHVPQLFLYSSLVFGLNGLVELANFLSDLPSGTTRIRPVEAHATHLLADPLSAHQRG